MSVSCYQLLCLGVGDRSCGAFMSHLFRDPHPTCARCRGVKCTSDVTCDICKDWSVAQWEAFLKRRPYIERRKKCSSGSALPSAPPTLPPSVSFPSPSHGSHYQSRDRHRSRARSPSSDRLQSGKRSWQPEQSRRDREEAVVASCDRGNSGSTVEPAPLVAGGSIPLPTSSFLDLVRLFLSLSGPVVQRNVAVGSLLLAATATGAGVLPGPATPVPSAAPVACLSAMPAPGVSAPTGAASPGRCEHARESSRSERSCRRSSGRERSHSGGKCGKGQSPSPARSARLASVSASSSSESSDSEKRVSAMPPPPSG